MAQKTFVDGDVLTASDINTYLMGEGGAWTSYTPTLSQGASSDIAKTVGYSKYARHGRMITWTFSISPTAAGTSGSALTLTLPVTAASTAGVRGSGQLFDSGTAAYGGQWVATTTTAIVFIVDASQPNSWGVSPAAAIASGDGFDGSITYEAAS